MEHGEPRIVLERMLEIYDVAEVDLERDIRKFIDQLSAARLIEVEQSVDA
jgi:hypothetical protein